MSTKKRGLGMGLEALFDASSIDVTGATVRTVALSSVEPSGDQPRKEFDEEALASLAESIRLHGILQPLIVREKNGRFVIVAGERRWRAARIAGLSEVPVMVKDFDDAATFEVALVENLQRENLSPMELSRGYKLLIDRFGLTQEEIAAKVGRSRPAVANALRLATLPESVVSLLEAGKITEGHARALIGLPGDRAGALAELAADGKVTVRQLEEAAKKPEKVKAPEPPKKPAVDYAIHLEKRLGRELGRKVRVRSKKIEIEYYGNEDLDALLARLGLPVEEA